MSGIVGGHNLVTDSLTETPLYGRGDEREHYDEEQGWEVLARYPAYDPSGGHFFRHNSNLIAVYGTPSQPVDSKFAAELFEDPEKLLAKVDGTFLVIGINPTGDQVVIGTDKLGAHPCYYVLGRPVFATTVAACIPQTEPTVDTQSIADFLHLGHLWGDRTLVQEVKAMRPATVYTYNNGYWEESRYWKPSYEEQSPGTAYLDELAKRFQTAIDQTAVNMPEQAGLWLSGGLDSRTTAAAFTHTNVELRGYSYNANPPTGDNTEIATRVGQRLGIPVSQVPLTEETMSPDRIERLIDVCDGMVRWNTTLNLSPSYDVDEPVLFEGVEGSLMGDHLLRSHFRKTSDPVESLRMSEGAQPLSLVDQLLSFDTDPMQTLISEVERTDETSFRRQVLDVHFQNYYNRLALASNAVIRDVTADRVVYTNGDYLDWCAGLPLNYRKGVLPFTNGVPLGTSRAKLGLSRRFGGDLSWVTYERTKLPPKLPYPLHICGFFGNVGLNRLRNKATYGNGQILDFWLRRGGVISEWVKSELESASNRNLFNPDMMDLWERHQHGKNLSPIIAQITTLEWWLTKYIDNSY